MADAGNDSAGVRLESASGLGAEFNANGSLRRLDCGSVSVLLFVGNELEGGPANLYLRQRSSAGCVHAAARTAKPDAPGATGRPCLDRRGSLAPDRIFDCADARSGRAGVVLAGAAHQPIGTDAGSRPDLCAGPGTGALWRGAHERVLRQPVSRSHAAARPPARSAGGVAPEPGSRWPPSVEPDRLAANGDAASPPTRCSSMDSPRVRARSRWPAAASCRRGACSTSTRWSCCATQPLRLEPGRAHGSGLLRCRTGGPPASDLRGGSRTRTGLDRIAGGCAAAEGAAMSPTPVAVATPSSGATLFSSAPLLQAADLDRGRPAGAVPDRRGGTRSAMSTGRCCRSSTGATGTWCCGQGAAGAASAWAAAAHRSAHDAG